MAAIEERKAICGALSWLLLAQARMDLEAELSTSGDGGVDMDVLETEFIKAAGPYGQRKGISYDHGEPQVSEPPVLKAAGISRGSRG